MKKIILIVYGFVIPIVSAQRDYKKDTVEFVKKYLIFDNQEIIDSMFFTPDQSYILKKVIVGLIDAETTRIECALFRITDTDITQALIRAHKRGVVIEMVVDSGAVGLEHYSTISALQSHGIKIYVYQSIQLLRNQSGPIFFRIFGMQRVSKGYSSIMHHKTFIFYNSFGKSVIIYGSLNPTYAAFNGNEEVVSIRSQAQLVDRWKSHFAKLQSRSLPL